MLVLNPTINKEEEFILKNCLPLSLDSPFANGLIDDVAFLKSKGKIIISTDSVCEGIHYKVGTSAENVGYKCLARNLSDVACKGANPMAFSLAIFKAKNTTTQFLEQFLLGMKGLIEEFSIPLIGGDVTSTNNDFFSANITIFGEKKGAIPERKGAKVGDFIYITGEIGRAFLGFMGEQEFLKFYEKPVPQIKLMKEVCSRYKINSSIDISDGFIKDLSSLLVASKKGGYINFEKLHISKSDYPVEKLITFGDDYQIIFTSKDEIKTDGITKIGVITKDAKLKLEGFDGKFKIDGYSHF